MIIDPTKFAILELNLPKYTKPTPEELKSQKRRKLLSKLHFVANILVSIAVGLGLLTLFVYLLVEKLEITNQLSVFCVSLCGLMLGRFLFMVLEENRN